MLGKILSTFKLWLTFVWAKQLYTYLLTYYSDTYHMCTWCFQSLIITFSSNTSSQSWSNIWSRRSTFLDQAIGPQVPFRKKYETTIMTASKHTSPNFFQMLQLKRRHKEFPNDYRQKIDNVAQLQIIDDKDDYRFFCW